MLGLWLGLPAGVLVFLYGQGRILLEATRDGLFGVGQRTDDAKPAAPQPDDEKPEWRWESVWAGGVSILVSGGLIWCGVRGDLLTKFVNVATGAAFAIVAIGTVVLRIRRPDLPRTFTAPFLPVAATIATTLLGEHSDDAAVTAVRVAIATTVPVVFLMLAIHAHWRMRLERLASAPGPVLVYPIQDRSGGNGEDERAEAVRALLQRRLLDTQLQRSTAIPSAGGSSDFLGVVETAGAKIEGWRGALLRLARFLSPVSSYEVRCSILDPCTVGVAEPCVLLIELTRLPRMVVPLEIIPERSWEAATAKAGDWLVATVLPRTRQCYLPPWTLRRNLQIPVELFRHYQEFRGHRDAGEHERALAALEKALRADPTNLALRLDKGKLQEQMRQYLPALKTYEGIIASAARLDRRLAYLRFGPPTRDQERGSITDPRWYDTRRAAGLDPRHPVVYTARYRYALLLGLGQEIAKQWYDDAYSDGHQYDALRHRFAETYHEPAQHLRDQFPDIAKHCPDSENSEALIELILKPRLDSNRSDSESLIAVFLTSMGVWEVENLIIERTGVPIALRYRRAHREIIPDRSLRLLLPRAILRRALALHRFGVTDDKLHLAESSMIYPIDEPVVEPALRKLLEKGWPADGSDLAKFIRTVIRRRFGGSLQTWHVHYNAACNMAILLKGPGWDEPSEKRRQVVRAIITELEKSVACGDLGYIASTSKWVGEQDPDLTEVHEEDQFKEFRRQIFDSGNIAGPGPA
jgi:tetratricopeptide (TPR) repeat protein